MKRCALAAAVVAAAALLALPLAAAARPAAKKSTVVAVKATEFKFVLSRLVVPKGVVVFRVSNAGKLPHDFKIAGRTTLLIQPGRARSLVVRFAKAGKFPYLCTVAGHAAAGMKGVLVVR